MCALWLRCVFVTSHPSPRALAYADVLRCRYALLQEIPDALQSRQGAPLIFFPSYQLYPTHHVSCCFDLAAQTLRPQYDVTLLPRLNICMLTALNWQWRVSPVLQSLLCFSRAHILPDLLAFICITCMSASSCRGPHAITATLYGGRRPASLFMMHPASAQIEAVPWHVCCQHLQGASAGSRNRCQSQACSLVVPGMPAL